jgi:hypothetical protein
LNLDSARISIIECVSVERLYFKLCYSTCISPGFSIIKELTVEVDPSILPKSQPTVEDVKVSTNGTSTEKEDNKGDKSGAAAAEQAIEPEATPSKSKPESAKSPPVTPVKNREDGSTDEADKKQSGTNDVSPRATESIRYLFFILYEICMSLARGYLVYSEYNHKLFNFLGQ